MKNLKNAYPLMNGLMLLLLGSLVLGGCQTTDSNTNPPTSTCDSVAKIEGVYSCSGQCVVTDSTGNRTLITVTGEKDTVQLFSGESKGLYQVNIGGGNDFHEIEIGAFDGQTLRTATSKVSDGQYPVLEEYVFNTNQSCEAVGFIKTVRNPTHDQFKACVIYCQKNTQ